MDHIMDISTNVDHIVDLSPLDMDHIVDLSPLDVDHVLQTIFLHLDPSSLRSCSSVCRRWHEFIQKEIWQSRRVRPLMEKRLRRRWRTEEPTVREMEESTHVEMSVCDDMHIVCVFYDDTITIYLLATGEKVKDLHSDYPAMGTRALDTGTNVVAVCANFGIRVWDKDTGQVVLSHSQHHRDLSVKNDVIVAVSDEDVVIYKYGKGRMRVRQKFQHEQERVGKMDIDGEYIVLVGKDGYGCNHNYTMKLWRVSSAKYTVGMSEDSVQFQQIVHTGYVESLVLAYPHVVTVSGVSSVRVWDLVTGTMLRYVGQSIGFMSVVTNGDIVAVMSRMGFTDLYNMEELVEDTDKEVWTRRLETNCDTLNSRQISINKTMIVGVENGKVVKRSFWI